MTYIIIPTLNEAKNIGRICQEILTYLPEAVILVVDDNSTDTTQNIVEKIGQKDKRVRILVRKNKPKSFAQSYLDGFKTALTNHADYIIQMDADFSHDPKYLPEIVKKLKDNDVVIGSRYLNGNSVENWSIVRKFLSRGGNIFASLATNLPLNDLTSGFVGWRSTTLQKIDFKKIKTDGYAFQIELKYMAALQNAKIIEIPIVFIDRVSGGSKMNKKIVAEAMIFCTKLLLYK